ncbi:DEAD/DEAH box helicase [Bacillus sp. 2205SS5-2]|uniref:DEAD/DEAH box helicase n=1 Tax=Bacillus sp. 2205SS5-2 TaxID=3109031 RepID=UPI00300558F5
MNIKINQKLIIDQCGTVSFKRGESYYKQGKVQIEETDTQHCKATVIGSDDFHVTVNLDSNEDLQTSCSCPKLASFDLDCQHVAAVLIALNSIQRKSNSNDLTEDFLTLFHPSGVRSSAHQRHFETREVLELELICSVHSMGGDRHLFGIDIKMNSTKVENIRDFLFNIKAGRIYKLSHEFLYNPKAHCFQSETEAILRKLMTVIQDEKLYMADHDDQNTLDSLPSTLLIPPSSWEELMNLLTKAPDVTLEMEGKSVQGLRISKEPIPLAFDFSERKNHGYTLKITGLNRMVLLTLYHLVYHDGALHLLKQEEFDRLSELKGMLEDSRMTEIRIPEEKMSFFLEKVAMDLKKIGKVTIAPSITTQFMKTPLVAKLYLDRVKNRLLAGLEFQYEHVLLNPLENRELPNGTMVVRDVEKEEKILSYMEESSFAKTEGGYFLHNEELEYDFLTYTVPKLQKLVGIYATTAVRNRIFRGNARPQIRVKVKRERTNWLEFKFEMDDIPEREIHQLLSALEEKRKYYRLRNGSLLSLETREVEEIQRFLLHPGIEKQSLANGLDLPMNQCLELLDTVDSSEGFALEESFRDFLNSIRDPGSLLFEVPQTIKPILRDYQIQGYQWMKTIAHYGFGGILADDMGLGKTLQSITFLQSILNDIRRDKKPALIVCPSSLTYNWRNEFAKFTPDIQVKVLDGNLTQRKSKQMESAQADVVITSYPIIRRDILWYEKQTFSAVFFDEAQAFKNPVTQTARAVKKIQATHRFALTGTPVENSIEELWSIFHVVFPQLFLGLKEYSQLTRRTIARRVRPFMLRRVKEDVLAELPQKQEYRENVELYPQQKKLYAAYLAKLRQDTLKHLDKDTLSKNRIKILAGITRLRQICCHPGLFVDGYQGGSSKLTQLMNVLEEAKNSGRRVLIFSQFTKMLGIIGRELATKGMPYFYLDGSTPSEERVELCHRYNVGERDVFLISLKAGGTGLNLPSADTVILFDTWWNPAVEEQAADRAHRMGQRNIVQVIKLIASGTIEEKMNELQEKKRHLIEELIDPDEKASSGLTEEDIKEILMIQ